ncbi:hypothetical protein GLOTRDRAFT_131174 [Gloeophyllum trabeum ATCC 11539]|uniref:Uncharacterized protein n=1 Tax=Gloeophyllum trabeum (strain ATCC 11539 / FP-39264 / Madison 617) TaxID=670483 RepID=S7RMA3_GLOTA|nr:uncharacterized protein GLOTRDRAFT_131174 [Gloeophyllum trabeum ATCC 11539]EPQ53844.1 hypothetical protein GLOTRDRAFT_131174 [Gloeophyllum trabeum ATCC 11539]
MRPATDASSKPCRDASSLTLPPNHHQLAWRKTTTIAVRRAFPNKYGTASLVISSAISLRVSRADCSPMTLTATVQWVIHTHRLLIPVSPRVVTSHRVQEVAASRLGPTKAKGVARTCDNTKSRTQSMSGGGSKGAMTRMGSKNRSAIVNESVNAFETVVETASSVSAKMIVNAGTMSVSAKMNENAGLGLLMHGLESTAVTLMIQMKTSLIQVKSVPGNILVVKMAPLVTDPVHVLPPPTLTPTPAIIPGTGNDLSKVDTMQPRREGSVILKKCWRELTQPVDSLSEPRRAAKNLLAALVCRKFREICGVEEGGHWPEADEAREGPALGEEYFTPDFNASSNHWTNQEIFERVASLVMEDLANPNEREDKFNHSSVYFNAQTVKVLAKKAWEGYKVQARADRDPEKGWASEKHMEILDDLDKLWWELASDADKQHLTGIHINTTDHASNAPPALAPFDFMIACGWWDRYHQTYQDHISDWFEHGNPSGWEDIPNDEDEDEAEDEDAAREQAQNQKIEELYDERASSHQEPSQPTPNQDEEEDFAPAVPSPIDIHSGPPSRSDSLAPPATSTSGSSVLQDRDQSTDSSDGSSDATSVDSEAELDINKHRLKTTLIDNSLT